MKHYPSIDSRIRDDLDVFVFDKIDGSNIRAEWSAKRSEFYKFGSKNRLIDATDPILGRSIELIKRKYEKQLSAVFLRKKYESVICFFEFFGPKSFAGQHHEDDKHDVILFDIAPYKKGILPPKELFALLEQDDQIEFAPLLFKGHITPPIESMIRESKLPGMTFEGVVCKSDHQMFKIKSHAWLQKLKDKCGPDEALFRKLA